MNQTMTTEKIVENRQLEYEFSDAELQEMGEDLSERIIDHTRLEIEKKETTKSFSDVLKTKMAAIKKISHKINARQEVREVSCEVRYNEPVYGKKTLVRRDTFDSWVEDMTPEEFNLFNQERGYTNIEIDLPWSEEE